METALGSHPDSWYLNESPSEKEGKYTPSPMAAAMSAPSMKVPPKRKGNAQQMDTAAAVLDPQ